MRVRFKIAYIEADVCRVVRSIQFTGLAGGSCAFRAGGRLSRFETARLVTALLCRRCALSLPDHPRSATRWRFADGACGTIVDGLFVGHYWLEMAGNLIDFTCGDWPHLDQRAEPLDAALGPIRWYAPPPTFVWMTPGWRPVKHPNMLWRSTAGRAEHCTRLDNAQ